MSRLGSIERAAYRLSLVLGLAAAARFGWVLTRYGWHPGNPEPVRETTKHSPELPTLAELQRQISQPIASPNSIDSAIAAAMGSARGATAPNSIDSTIAAAVGSGMSAAAPAREFVKSYLSVQVGPARSELRVDGLLVGRTPYVGQIGCERGKTVKIDLLPPKGMPKHYEVPCLDGEMHLRDEP